MDAHDEGHFILIVLLTQEIKNCILNVYGWINLGEITCMFFQMMYKEI